VELLQVTFEIKNIPADAFVALSDEKKRGKNPAELVLNKLTGIAQGNWEDSYNSDGGIISGLPTELDESWNIMIIPNFISGIDDWEFVTSLGSISLNDVSYITISSTTPDPDVGLNLLAGNLIVPPSVAVTRFAPESTEIYYDFHVRYLPETFLFEVSVNYGNIGQGVDETSLSLWRIPTGDVNLDGIVNNKDLVAIEKSIELCANEINPWDPIVDGPWDPNINNNGEGNYWNPLCDINKDGVVTSADYELAVTNLGSIWKNITTGIDTVNDIIYGETDSFSIFHVRRKY
jgi:hypothetical protein